VDGRALLRGETGRPKGCVLQAPAANYGVLTWVCPERAELFPTLSCADRRYLYLLFGVTAVSGVAPRSSQHTQ
jgi:hypothetical protein